MKKIVIVIIAGFFPFCLSAQKKLANKPIDIYLCIGQSNMAGMSPIEDIDKGSFDNTLVFNDKNEWEQASCNTETLNKYSTVKKPHSQELGVSFGFAKKIESQAGNVIGIVANARSGTRMEWWQKGYEGENDNNLYEEAVKRTKAALAANPNGVLKAILWHQGEGDNSSPNKELYMERLKKLVDDLRTDLEAPKIPFIAGEVGKWKGRGRGVNPVIRQISDHISHAYWVSSDGLTSMNIAKNNPHFGSADMRALGGRYADKVLEIIYKKPAGGVIFYNESSLKERSVQLKAGKYPISWLEKIGIKPEEIASVKLDKGYKADFLSDKKLVHRLLKNEKDFNTSFDTVIIKYK